MFSLSVRPVPSQEAEEAESPKRSIRDSGYIDCWDSERSDSLSPPRHGREDSFDSLDSFGSRSRQTPSPDVLVARGSSDGREGVELTVSGFQLQLFVLLKESSLAPALFGSVKVCRCSI